MPEGCLIRIGQAFRQLGTPAGKAKGHLLRQEIVFAGIRSDLQQDQAGKHHQETEMQKQDRTQISRHAVHGILQEPRQDIAIMIGNKVIQRQAGMTQGRRICLGVNERFFQHEKILLDGRILDKAEFFPQ